MEIEKFMSRSQQELNNTKEIRIEPSNDAEIVEFEIKERDVFEN